MAGTSFYPPRDREIDANGQPLANAYFEFFEAGTSTPLPVYADVDLVTSLGAVVTANSGGLFAQMFMLPQAYDINLYDENNVLVWSAVDFFPPQAASSANVDLTGTAGVTFVAGELAYLSDGSGGLNAGQWYKADADLAYASGTPETGFAVAGITAGDSGLFRTSGKVTGLSGLVPGSLYYASGTAGAISTSPGTNSRMVGQAESTTVLVVQTNPPVPTNVFDARSKFICNGRLSLTSGTPVTTADVTAAATLYWALYEGDQVGLYSGTAWQIKTLTELSIAAPAVANQVYDVFMDYNDGTPILALTAWTNDTTPAVALVKQDGIYVKTGDTQQRFLGTVRTIAASQFNDSVAFRHVKNYYNRLPRPMRVVEATNTWNYTTATVRQANANTANQLDVVNFSVPEDPIDLEVSALVSNDNAGGGVALQVGIGEDSTTVVSTSCTGRFVSSPGANLVAQAWARLRAFPPAGRHIYTWLEYSQAVGTTTWQGDNGGILMQSGISGQWWG